MSGFRVFIRISCLFVAIYFTVCCNAQKKEAEDLVIQVFTDKEFAEDVSLYATGEYDGHPNANDLGAGINYSFKTIEQLKEKAVVNLTLENDSTGISMDTYLFLVKDKEDWKITSFRALASTGVLYETKLMMENLTDKDMDSLVRVKPETYKSKEEIKRELANINLTLALDDVIIAHFFKHEALFNKAKEELLLRDIKNNPEGYQLTDLTPRLSFDSKDLLLQQIKVSSLSSGGFEFVIGGMGDNQVGYLYLPEETEVPEMSADHLILLREIGEGWYLFKTT